MDLDMLRRSVFRVAASAMLGGAVLSALAALALAVRGAPFNTTGCSASTLLALLLSTAVCAIAYFNYSRALKVATSQNELVNETILQCRYADWLVTMPLLAVKVLEMARTNERDCAAASAHPETERAAVALVAFVMVGCGAAISTFPDKGDAFAVLFAVGAASLCVLLALILREAVESESTEAGAAAWFALVWVLYPVVFLTSQLSCSTQEHDDIAYAVLDVVSKAVLASFSSVSALER